METNQDKRKPFALAHEPAPSSADAVLSGSAGLLPAEGQPRRLEPEDEEGTLGRDLQDLQVSSSSARLLLRGAPSLVSNVSHASSPVSNPRPPRPAAATTAPTPPQTRTTSSLF